MSAPEPDETASFTATMDDGATIALRRWGPPRAERFVISHGNGLAIDAFSDFGSDLARDYEVVAFDMRNHGRNPVHNNNENCWSRFLKDFPQILHAIDTELGPKPTHGAFHSLSAVTCLMSAVEAPYPWSSLTLFEPPMAPPASSGLQDAMLAYHVDLARRAGARRGRFDTPNQLFQSMRRSPAMARISDRALSVLTVATLRPNGEAWHLACPPGFEAQVFEISPIAERWPTLARVDVPVQIVVGDRENHYAPILIDVGLLLAESYGFGQQELSGTTHFMQLEAPERCAALARDFARQHPS